MRYTLRTLTCAISLSAVSLTPVAVTATAISFFTADAAAAKNGNGNGGGRDADRGNNGNGNGHGNRSSQSSSRNSGNGAIASELRGLNAANANANARANASPNSQVGRIAAYERAALANIEAGAAVDEAEAQLAAAEDALRLQIAQYDGRETAEIQNDIEGLDPEADDYQDQLETLNTELGLAQEQEAIVSGLIDDVFVAELILDNAEIAAEDFQEMENEAFLAASNGRTVSDPAVTFFRELLGLPVSSD